MIYLIINASNYSLSLKEELLLKKDNLHKKIEVFQNDKITLIEKNKFFIRNVISLTEFFTKKEINKTDILIDLDYEETLKNETFIINKISYNDYIYTTDILYKHHFSEGEIVINGLNRENIIIQDSKEEIKWKEKNLLYNSFGVFEVANNFFNIHQIIIARILFYEKKNFLEMIKKLVKLGIEIEKMYQEFAPKDQEFTNRELEKAKEISKKLKFSTTINIEFMNLLKYHKILHRELEKFLIRIEYLIEKEENIDKKRGKILFEYIKKSIME
ncbi:hypothetical protein [Fusobacterium sp. PH5-44]|uniref:hypothetical protein n=1 Tax=unclassified Fusobacterium TaxID=2648384 RepID=UPI003D1D1AEA